MLLKVLKNYYFSGLVSLNYRVVVIVVEKNLGDFYFIVVSIYLNLDNVDKV